MVHVGKPLTTPVLSASQGVTENPTHSKTGQMSADAMGMVDSVSKKRGYCGRQRG
jgi:hypothetical protein